ncbi:BCL2/adenovirus E1B 19 kDa protein-interacting protein 2 isoform X5 [Lampris incognitus]|uniref:BCL2/adenovirus E1B 19 kDa protein-interacting protein 2 isoform X5 n=1 Tax=Lampris incognitus TaxID=2546036 RepID=UPI0024B5BAEE|nr:BCL2/adenovirus E1B 19 kDa protein-interacting protein 2 isoform X5 [Lampris incognitus]
MASDVTESQAALKGLRDPSVNNGSPRLDTPGRTHGDPGSRGASSPSSPGVSGDGGGGDSDETQRSAVSAVDNGGEAPEESRTETGGSPQERTAPDNGHKQPEARSSTPVASSRSPPTSGGPNGRPLPEEEELDEELFVGTSSEGEPGYAVNHGKKAKKKLAAPDISLNLDCSEGSLLSDELDESTELDLDDIDTPSDNSNEFEWEDDLPKPKTTELLQKGVESVQEYSALEERDEGRRWRVFRIGDQEHRVDMKAIEPYKRVISHGGYYGDGLNAIIVFAVCFMPESNQPNYRYIMDNLFKYVIGTLELLVAENYMIVYLNGATSRKKMPTVGWLRKCYQQIDRRLRKNLKSLIIVHPSWFIRTLLALTKPFISSKFSQKIKYVYSLTDLAELVPMEYVSIPDCIKQFDDEKNRKTRKRIDQDMHGKVEIAAAAVPE